MSSVAASVPRISTSVGRHYSVLAAFLSYLFPGLGQIYQGRIVKGVLFFVCIYALYFYGMYLGSGTRKYEDKVYTVSSNVYLPDTADYPGGKPFDLPRPLANLYNRPQFAGQFWIGVAAWPAVWQYLTYDKNADTGGFPFGRFERTPSEEDLNVIHGDGNKFIELGWVYTVIAGVLNIMVIYDAFAGPAFLAQTEPKKEGHA